MLRRCGVRMISMNFSPSDNTRAKRPWSELFFKPATSDERVKEYVPEVLEETLAEQRAGAPQQSTRDVIVEHGNKVLREMENKAPATTLYPSVNRILALYGSDHLISQRGLNLLVYPSTAPCYQQTQPPELVSAFQEHFKTFVESVEQNGSYVHDVSAAAADVPKERDADGEPSPAAAPSTTTADANEEVVDATAATQAAEPADVTYLVKCISGMAMANVQIGDGANALRCCDAALAHVMDGERTAALLALKAGIQVRLKDYAGAIDSAKRSIAQSPHPQAYLQGAAALRMEGDTEGAIALLTSGKEALPDNETVAALLEESIAAKKKMDERQQQQHADGTHPQQLDNRVQRQRRGRRPRLGVQ